MNLLRFLAADLVAALDVATDGVPRRVLLWLDPEGQFRRLVGHLEKALAEKGITLLRCGSDVVPGQFDLKLALLRLEAQVATQVVVYLPGWDRSALEPHADGSAPDLWSVYEYRFKGWIWGQGGSREAGVVAEPFTLATWLVHHGLKIADRGTTAKLAVGGADSLLSRYTERQRVLPIEEWPRPLRLDDVNQALAGDPRDALRRLLAAPQNEVRRWGADRTLILARIADEYGILAQPAQPNVGTPEPESGDKDLYPE